MKAVQEPESQSNHSASVILDRRGERQNRSPRFISKSKLAVLLESKIGVLGRGME